MEDAIQQVINIKAAATKVANVLAIRPLLAQIGLIAISLKLSLVKTLECNDYAKLKE